jgi:transcriptional regulator with XRE-family HTH domain
MIYHSPIFEKSILFKAVLILIIMILGENMMLTRKKKGLSQADLGRMIGTSGDVIGRYERGDITPSIDVVSKISDALEVSIDYLIGKTKMELDKQALKRLEDISMLPEENKKFILNLIDMALRDFKVKKAHNS